LKRVIVVAPDGEDHSCSKVDDDDAAVSLVNVDPTPTVSEYRLI